MKNLTPSITVFLSLFFASCSQQPSLSETQFAFYPMESSFSGMTGKIEVLRQGFETNYSDLNICVGKGRGSYSDEEFLLETKLAYSMWLNSNNNFGQAEWDLFDFVQQDGCEIKDSSFAAQVVIKAFPSSIKFNPIIAECSLAARRISCGSGTTTLGYGGPGGMSYRSFQRTPDEWVKISLSSPSTTALNPNVNWESITTSVSKNENTSENVKQLVINQYDIAMSNPTFSNLNRLASLLETYSVLGRDSDEISQLLAEMQETRVTRIRREINPTNTAMSTLLHEVGHQQGMDHADDVDATSISGGLEIGMDLDGSEIKRFQTDAAAMAYGDPYLYMTFDDKAGVNELSASLTEFLQGHKPRQ